MTSRQSRVLSLLDSPIFLTPTPILISMFHEAVDVLVIEVTFRGVVMVGAIKVAQTITTTILITVTKMLNRIIILKEAIEVVVVLGVVTVVVPTAVVRTMVKMLGTI